MSQNAYANTKTNKLATLSWVIFAMVQQSSFIDELLQFCWDRVVLHTGKDFIYVTQTRAFIAEMEAFLAAKNLFKEDELLLLESMARGKPHLTLHRKALNSFLLKLVPFRSLEEFLETRTGSSKYDIMRLVGNLSITTRDIKREDTYLRNEARMLPPERDTARPFLETKYESLRGPPEPLSRYREGKEYLEGPKEKYNTRPLHTQETSFEKRPYSSDFPYERADKYPIYTSERPYSSGLFFSRLSINQENGARLPEDLQELKIGENSDSSTLVRSQKRRIQELEDKVHELSRKTRLLELQKKSPSQRSNLILSDLSAQILEKEDTIRSLEKLCDRYQTDLANFAAVDKSNSAKTNKITEALNTQDELIKKLKQRLQLEADNAGSDSSKLKNFLMTLPFIKQYFVYFKYQLDQRNFSSILVNLLTLFFTCVLVLNVLKMLLYGAVALTTRLQTGFSEYVYDVYDSSDEIRMVWWREIPWLEYGISSMWDWLQ